jgi:hypothetical protein
MSDDQISVLYYEQLDISRCETKRKVGGSRPADKALHHILTNKITSIKSHGRSNIDAVALGKVATESHSSNIIDDKHHKI